jgi:hypothetical protein
MKSTPEQSKERVSLHRRSHRPRRKVCLAELDLSKLIGGRAFTVPSRIALNGYSISTDSLADSGANGFIDTQLAVDAAKFFGINAERLPVAWGTKGFDGKLSSSITHVIFLHLWLDYSRSLSSWTFL